MLNEQETHHVMQEAEQALALTQLSEKKAQLLVAQTCSHEQEAQRLLELTEEHEYEARPPGPPKSDE